MPSAWTVDSYIHLSIIFLKAYEYTVKLTLGLTKKNNKKKKSVVTERFGYVKRNGECYLVIQSWKHSYVGLAYRLVVGINIA